MPSTIRDRVSILGTGATPNGENATISQKVPCRVATTENITLAGLQTLDGVSVAADDRVLVKNQTDASENGIYLASADAWQRTADAADAGDLVKGSQVRVNEGTVGPGIWYCTSDDPITIGTDDITWVDAATTDLSGAEIKALYEGEADTNTFTDAEQTKVGHLTVTAATDLDAIRTRVADLDESVVLRGSWDASTGSFPGGGTAQAGDSYIVSVAGTVDSVTFAVKERIIAISDNASTTTFAANWFQQAASGEDIDYDTKSDLEAATIVANINLIRIGGFTTVGDGGGASYTRVGSEPTHAGKIQSNDGAWWELADIARGKVNALSFGMSTAETAANNATALQAACDAMGDDGCVVVPPGSYALNTITLTKNSNGTGRFVLDAFGSDFTGTPEIILDSSKSVSLVGVDMPTGVLRLRGVWFSQFDRCRIAEIVWGDLAGTTFDLSLWNNFNRCELQVLEYHSGGFGPWNANSFDACTFRGNASQNFTVARDHAILFNGNSNVQNLVFRSCDFSEYAVFIIDVGVASVDADILMVFNDCYFDQPETVPLWNIDRDQVSVRVNNCHHSSFADNVLVRDLTNMDSGPVSLFASGLQHGVRPYCAVNLVPNGDLAAATGASSPVFDYNGAGNSDQVGEGIHNRFHRITQGKTTGNSVYVGRVLAPWKGLYTAQALVKHGGVGTKTMRWRFNAQVNNFGTVVLDDTDWSFITMTINFKQPKGQDLRVGFFTDDATSFTLDLLYVAIVAGVDPPFFLAS